MTAFLKLMVGLTSLLFGDWIPSDRDNFNPNKKTSAPFEEEMILVHSLIGDDSLRMITINVVTPENAGSLQPFKESGFEFRSLRHFSVFQEGEFTVQQYRGMLRGAIIIDESTLSNRGVLQIDYPKLQSFFRESPVMAAIIRELNELHFPDSRLKFLGAVIANRGKNEHRMNPGGDVMTFVDDKPDTALHFDIRKSGSTAEVYRLWIPLDVIDNLHLGLGSNVPKSCHFQGGDIAESRCSHRLFKEAQWYQSRVMGPETMIFLDSRAVPHFSADLRESFIPGLRTNNRQTLAVSIQRNRIA